MSSKKSKDKNKKKAKAPVLGSSNHVLQENHDKEAGKRHGLGSKNINNNDNNKHIDTKKPGKDLNLLNSDVSDSEDSLYGDASCPCTQSDTNSWLLICTKCNQTWHSSCANLKGVSEEFVTSLELWLCPWCFVTPIRKPQSYFTETVIEADGSAIYNFSKEFETLTKSVTKTISDSITKLESNMSNKLQQIDQFKQSQSSAHNNVLFTQTQTAPNGTETESNVNFTHNETHIDEVREQFLDAESCANLFEYFKGCKFSSENGHSVCSFGEKYRYNGSKSEPSEIPQILSSVIDKINDIFDIKDGIKINSCLVNKFDGPN